MWESQGLWGGTSDWFLHLLTSQLFREEELLIWLFRAQDINQETHNLDTNVSERPAPLPWPLFFLSGLLTFPLPPFVPPSGPGSGELWPAAQHSPSASGAVLGLASHLTQERRPIASSRLQEAALYSSLSQGPDSIVSVVLQCGLDS